MTSDIAKTLAKKPTYAIYSDDGPNNSVRTHIPSQSLIVSLENLKATRNNIYNPFASYILQPSAFVAPASDDHPYNNKIGPLRENDSNHWGYKFGWGDKIISVWIEKQKPEVTMDDTSPLPTLKQDLEDPLLAEVMESMTIREDEFETGRVGDDAAGADGEAAEGDPELIQKYWDEYAD